MERYAESNVWVPASPEKVFAKLDDQRTLSAHMSQRSWMTLGSRFRIDLDQWAGRRVGSVMGLSGRLVGLPLSLKEVITHHEPGVKKEWMTLEEPRLLVVGSYRMGFIVKPEGNGTRLTVWIAYQLPSGRFTRVLGWLLGPLYARWCARRMAQDAQKDS